MVLVCCYPRCFSREKRRRFRPENLSFHRLPVSDPQRLRLWLLALRMDLNSTSYESLLNLRICSEHFSPDDFKRQAGRISLKTTAIPNTAPPLENFPAASETQEMETTLTLVSSESPDHTQYGGLQMVLTSPQATDGTSPSTSCTYTALPPTWSYEADTQAPWIKAESMEDGFEDDISMSSADVPPGASFVPGPTGISAPSPEESGETGTWKDRKWLVNHSSLMQLFENCQQCGGTILEPRVSSTGSQVRVEWGCLNGHGGVWTSCPDAHGMPENYLLFSASTLFTGATYPTIADWAELLNLQTPKKETFYSIQSSHLIPAVDVKYKEQHKAIMDRLLQTQTGVHVSGDGRSDSSSCSAKYNTYSFMEDATKEIVQFDLVQATEASSSAAMEPVLFRRGLDYLLQRGVEVEVVTTDTSPSIKKIMQEDYSDIHHEFDVRHVVKSLMKKLLTASNQTENRDLQPWIKSICNHLWYACATCGGDPDVLTEKWKSLLHHICGVHRWEEDGEQKTCQHGDLSPEEQRRKRWLQRDSAAFRTLSSFVLDQRLMQDLRRTALFKHAGNLQAFHSSLQKYTEKGLPFHYSSMKARTQLAIMDHNEKARREQAAAASVDPTQTFRQNLVEEVLQRRSDPSVAFEDPTPLAPHPPLPQNPSVGQYVAQWVKQPPPVEAAVPGSNPVSGSPPSASSPYPLYLYWVVSNKGKKKVKHTTIINRSLEKKK